LLETMDSRGVWRRQFEFIFVVRAVRLTMDFPFRVVVSSGLSCVGGGGLSPAMIFGELAS